MALKQQEMHTILNELVLSTFLMINSMLYRVANYIAYIKTTTLTKGFQKGKNITPKQVINLVIFEKNRELIQTKF